MSGIELVSGEKYAHGTRARYVGAKCRCEECRRANRDYARARAQADYNGLVDAGPARAHLFALSDAGVGKRAVAAASDVAASVIQDVRNGTKTRIRTKTAQRILAVDTSALSDHALVPAKETKAALREMQRLGLTKTEIAQRLGSASSHPLQLGGRKVTALNALKVRKLLEEVRGEAQCFDICAQCGQSHTKERRRQWVRAHRELDSDEMKELQSCWYGGSAGERQLHRDRAEVRGEAS